MKTCKKAFFNIVVLASLIFSLPLTAQEADDIRGGWMADVDGIRHIYLLVVRGKTVSGIYCTDCSNPLNLAFVDDGVLDESGLRFNIYHDSGNGQVNVDKVRAELINGDLHISRHPLGSSATDITMVLKHTPPEAIPPVTPRNPALTTTYVPPAPPELISADKVLGLWIWGTGPNKQNFIFKQHRNKIRGMVCGPCEDTLDMAVLEGITMSGTNFHFEIIHEDSGPGIVEYGPHANITDATIAKNELHMKVVPTYEPADFIPIEMTLLGPIRFQQASP